MRVRGWQWNLREWAAQRLGDPFEWGQMDCALIVAEAVDAMTGSHHAAEYRGRYRNARQSLKLQRRLGIDLRAGLERAGAFQWAGAPQFGDFILHPHPEHPWVCGHVCFGPLCLTAFPDEGVAFGHTAAAMGQPGAGVWRLA